MRSSQSESPIKSNYHDQEDKDDANDSSSDETVPNNHQQHNNPKKFLAFFRNNSMSKSFDKEYKQVLPQSKKNQGFNIDKFVNRVKGLLRQKSDVSDLCRMEMAKADRTNISSSGSFHESHDVEPLRIDSISIDDQLQNITHEEPTDNTGIGSKIRCDTMDKKLRNNAEISIKSVLKKRNIEDRSHKSRGFSNERLSKDSKALFRSTSCLNMTDKNFTTKYVLDNQATDRQCLFSTIDRKKWSSYINMCISRVETQEVTISRSISGDEGYYKIHADIMKLRENIALQNLPNDKKIRFYSLVKVFWIEHYDRSAPRTWINLSNKEKSEIRRELNEFKECEMIVHENSKKYTRFH